MGVDPESPGTLIIRYFCEEHNDACKNMASRGFTFRSRAASATLFGLVKSNASQTNDFFYREYMRPYAEAAMAENGFSTVDELIDWWCEDITRAPRDAIITEKDIRNARQAAVVDLYKFDPDDAQSVHMWVKAHPPGNSDQVVILQYEPYNPVTKVNYAILRSACVMISQISILRYSFCSILNYSLFA